MNNFKSLLAESVASSRVKAKKKWPGGPKFLEDIETAKGFGGEFKTLAKKKALSWLGGLIGL